MAGPCSDAVVSNAHDIALDNELDINATPQSIAAHKADDIADTTSFNAISNIATPKQDHVNRQNRYL